MTLEKQVVSLDLAKRLKELGVKQESLFEYRLFDLRGESMVWSKPILVGSIPNKLGNADVGFGSASAFTVAELGEIMAVLKDDLERVSSMFSPGHGWFCRHVIARGKGEIAHVTKANTEADARAKTLIYLLENGLINQ
jgi:hypothetical protein